MFNLSIAEFRGVFADALNWYEHSTYQALFIFCSSLNPNDREITKLVAANKEYIDSLTGKHNLYIFFNNADDDNKGEFNCSDIRFIDKITRLYQENSHSINIRTTIDICKRYGINKDLLPALILVKERDDIELFPVENYSNLETYLYAASFVSDYFERVDNEENYYGKLAKKFADKMRDKLYLDEDRTYKLLMQLYNCKDKKTFCRVLTGVLRAVSETNIILNRKLQQLIDRIENREYDVFISCKSEDYDNAKELSSFLEANGKKPFLADLSMRNFKHDEYGDVIKGVIDICDTMIVFTTNPAYPDTPYVRFEWTVFSHDINTGKKQGKLLTVIPSDMSPNELPIGLRHVEAFRIYKEDERLLNYINTSEDRKIDESPSSTTNYVEHKKSLWIDRLLSFMGKRNI